MSSSIRRLSILLLLAAAPATGCAPPEGDVAARVAALTGRKGVDYSFARPSPSGMAGEGYSFVVRYFSYDNSGTNGKILFKPEADGLIAAGLDVVSNWEYAADDALNGYNAGVADAKEADAQAAAAGAPATRPIYFSVDFDATPGDQTAINSYFDGVASVIGLPRTGAYGGYYVIQRLFDAGKIKYGWQTYAWSGGQWDNRAQLRQTQNGITAAGDGSCCDLDEANADDFGQWGHAPDWAAAYVSQSWPLATTAMKMTAGQTIKADITLKNTGAKAWDTNTKLGTTDPRDRSSPFADASWPGPNRAAHVTGTVPPGGTFKFSFNFHAPPQAGSYHEHFSLVEEGVAWFSDPGQGGPPDNQIEAYIEVAAAPNPQPGPADGGAVEGGGDDGGAIGDGSDGGAADGAPDGGDEGGGGGANGGNGVGGVHPTAAARGCSVGGSGDPGSLSLLLVLLVAAGCVRRVRPRSVRARE